MSSIASFIRLPKSAVAGLRDAAVPQKRIFGGLKDTFHDFIEKNGEEVASYDWSGYVLATLLPYLDEQGINIMKSEHDELSRFLSEKRQSTCFILTISQKEKYVGRLEAASFSVDALRDYFNEFNATKESEIGEAMLDGITCIRESLESIDDSSIVLLEIG